MVDTPKSAFPTISDQATVRIKLGLLVSIIVAIVGGTVWLTNMKSDAARTENGVNELRAWAQSFDRRIGNLEEALGIPRSRSAAFGPPPPGVAPEANP